jgi:hypothetical protein
VELNISRMWETMTSVLCGSPLNSLCGAAARKEILLKEAPPVVFAEPGYGVLVSVGSGPSLGEGSEVAV